MSVDVYLDDLFDALAGTGRAGRRALAEAEDHLRTATEEAQATGLSLEAAEARAVQRFGATGPLVLGIRRAHFGLSGVARSAFMGSWLVGAMGLIAAGFSGLLAEAFGHLFGAGFVAGDGAGVTYTAQRCADFFEYVPSADSCASAAAQHHWGEVVDGRVALGVLGLVALVALIVARRTVLRGPRWMVPVPYVVMLALFGSVGVVFTGLSLMQIVFGQTSGVGVSLSDGLIYAVSAVIVVVLGVRQVRRRSLGVAGRQG